MRQMGIVATFGLAALFVITPRDAQAVNDIEVLLPICSQPFPALSYSFGMDVVTVTKAVDACSSDIAQAVAAGTTLKEAVLTISISSANPYNWIFSNVILTSVVTSNNPSSNPIETLTWSFGKSKIQWHAKGSPMHSHYASKLHSGDSVVHASNSGEAETVALMCLNIYAFTPDEQMVSCCSCPVTPNSLVSFSANKDLASNMLTPSAPDSMVITLVGTLPPDGGTCGNSAGAVATAVLAPGITAWGTTVHATPTPGALAVTETEFISDTLSVDELVRLSNVCNFIIANGSGFGVCRSCRLGGQ